MSHCHDDSCVHSCGFLPLPFERAVGKDMTVQGDQMVSSGTSLVSSALDIEDIGSLSGFAGSNNQRIIGGKNSRVHVRGGGSRAKRRGRAGRDVFRGVIPFSSKVEGQSANRQWAGNNPCFDYESAQGIPVWPHADEQGQSSFGPPFLIVVKSVPIHVPYHPTVGSLLKEGCSPALVSYYACHFNSFISRLSPAGVALFPLPVRRNLCASQLLFPFQVGCDIERSRSSRKVSLSRVEELIETLEEPTLNGVTSYRQGHLASADILP